jgi:hypothetical protein
MLELEEEHRQSRLPLSSAPGDQPAGTQQRGWGEFFNSAERHHATLPGEQEQAEARGGESWRMSEMSGVSGMSEQQFAVLQERLTEIGQAVRVSCLVGVGGLGGLLG